MESDRHSMNRTLEEENGTHSEVRIKNNHLDGRRTHGGPSSLTRSI